MKSFLLTIFWAACFGVKAQKDSDSCNVYKRVNFKKQSSATKKIVVEFLSFGKCGFTYEDRKRMKTLYNGFSDKNFLTSIEFKLPNCEKIYYVPIRNINKSI